jgi:hypothetical protein
MGEDHEKKCDTDHQDPLRDEIETFDDDRFRRKGALDGLRDGRPGKHGHILKEQGHADHGQHHRFNGLFPQGF